MTSEEAAHSREVRPKVRAVQSPPPPADLLAHIERLHAVASVGDRDAVVAALRSVVPEYTPAVAAVGAAPTPSGSG